MNMSRSRSIYSYFSIGKNMKVHIETSYHGFSGSWYRDEVRMRRTRQSKSSKNVFKNWGK